MMGLSPLIYAKDAVDVAITGRGTLDGQAGNTVWWHWNGAPRYGWKQGAGNQRAARTKLFQMAEDNVPVASRRFGVESFLRPAFIQPYGCTNVLVEDVTIRNSPMWEINPVLCRNVIVRGVQISSHGPNNDGCDPESCRDVLIERCMFDTGDDCIAIKSGRNADGRRVNVPSENIIVRDCEMRDGHGGVTIGSEISGGVRHVYAERNRMDSPQLDRALRLKNNAMRGGTLEHIYMRDVTVGQLADAVLQVDFLYEEGANGNFPPVVRDVELLRVTSKKSNYGLYLRGYEKGTIADVRVIDCTFDGVAKPDVVEHVTGLVRRNVTVNGEKVSS
jgi:polygalacturonase